MSTVLLYDEDCGLCQRSVVWAGRLGCRVEATPFQRWPHLAEHGITREAAEEALHVVQGGVAGDGVHGGTVFIGHEAVAATLRTSRHGAVRLAGQLLISRPVAPLARRAYAWVAAHRHQLPGGTATCALPTAPTPEESR